jgi:predicted lipoprotein with Yx(FWY)xxD motif
MTVDNRIVPGSVKPPETAQQASSAHESALTDRQRIAVAIRRSRKHRSGRKRATAIAAGLLAAATLTACGGGGGNGGGGGGGNGGGQAKSSASSGKQATIDVANSDLGKILVDSQGRTVYLFEKDTGPTSTCTGECATVWPPVRVNGSLTAGTGVDAAKLKTTNRSDGKPQVVYNGHPLYLFEGDSSPGDTTGQGNTTFGAGWFVLSPAGNKIGS